MRDERMGGPSDSGGTTTDTFQMVGEEVSSGFTERVGRVPSGFGWREEAGD